MQRACVVVVSPDQFFRAGIRHVLRATRYDVVGDVAMASQVGSGGQEPFVDLLIWSPGTTDDVAAEAVQLRTRLGSQRRARLLVVINTNDAHWVRRVAAVGVDAILSHGISIEVFPRMLEIVLLGEQVFPALLQLDEQPAVNGYAGLARAGPGLDVVIAPDKMACAGLSEREAEILHFIVSGASNKSIARELHVTEPTVKAHVKGVLRKIGVGNRTQAAVWATRAPP